jgi:hypothetical protein
MKPAATIFSALFLILSALAQQPPNAVTVPITLDHNRTIIDVYLPLPDGKTKRVRAWVDNGTAELDLTEALAQKLGIRFTGEPTTGPTGKERPATPPTNLQIGGMAISLANLKEAHALIGRESIAGGCSAEINIPATVLRNYDVLFDYPNRQLTIGSPGSIRFQGTRIKALLNAQNGLIQIPSKLAGQSYNIALDLGSSTALLSRELIDQWHADHPAWPHMIGAVSFANMWGADDEARWQLIRLPSIEYGVATLKNVAAAAFSPQSLQWFEKRADAPTIGLIGASAFLDYRVGIDYAHSTVYLQRSASVSAPDMDVVGLTLRPEPDNRYTIIGIADYNGKPSVPDVKAGDVLVGVDGAPATGATMGQVWSLLGGSPGQTRSLTLERDGKRFTVDAKVHRFLAPEPKKGSTR